jgi:adenylate cyclase
VRLPRLTDVSLYSICFLVLAVALVDLRWLHWFSFADYRLADMLVKQHAENRLPDPDIVWIDIDNRSLAEMDKDLGRFPWPRGVYGELIAELNRQGAKAIVFDVELYEPDTQRPRDDEVLNEVVVGSSNTFFPMQRLDALNAEEGIRVADYARLLDLKTRGTPDPNARVPLELPSVIDRSAWGRTGLINFREDDDGVGRSYWLAQNVGGWLIPSLPARVAKSLGYAVPDGFAVPNGNAFLLSWVRGGQFPHTRVSFSDVYIDLQKEKRQRPPKEFAGKVVIVGSSASYLRDFRVTPVSSLMPGVEILATAIDNLKQGLILTQAPRHVSYALVIVSFLLLLFALKRRWNLVQIFGLLVVGTLVLVVTAYAALESSLMLPVGVPLLFAWLFYFLAALRAYLREQRDRARTEGVLSRFLDPRLVKNLVAEGVKLDDIKSETRTISILFSDIRGFTTLAETRPAEEILALLNRYFSMQAETIFHHGGTLDKFIGDAIMAFWGAPTDDAAHAGHAVACALDMAQNLERFNENLAMPGVVLDIGIGIHTGSAVVGFVGSKRKLEYTAIGDTVNLASRIESETKGRSRILVSVATRDQCAELFDFRDLGEVVVKGRQAAVQVFAPSRRAPPS